MSVHVRSSMSSTVNNVHERIQWMGLWTKEAMQRGATRDDALKAVTRFAVTEMGWATQGSTPRDDKLDLAEASSAAGRQLPMSRFDPIISFAAAYGLGWLEHGFPVVRLGHKLAASLACTSFTREIMQDVELPWRVFAFVVPGGLISETDAWSFVAGPRRDLDSVRPKENVKHLGWQLKMWNVLDNFVHLGSEPSLSDHADVRADDLLKNCKSEDWDGAKNAFDLSAIMSRLLCGVCLEMATTSKSITARKAAGPPARVRGEPKSWVFNVSREVRLDCREPLRRHLRGESRGKLSVQHMVRGHYKMQRHGEGGAQRKWIHVEPYWRGDENAPIAVRSHVLGAES